MIVGAVSSADVNDTYVLEDSGESDAVLSEDVDNVTPVEEPQEASFAQVSKSNYIKGNDFEVSLCDENATGIANKTVSISLDGTVHNILTDENGTARLKISVQKGFYDVKYSFNETGYTPCEGYKRILVVTKPVSTLSAKNINGKAGIKYHLKITLKADGIALPNRTVKLVLNKKTRYAKTNSKGVASFVVYFSKGTYKAKYYFAGEENINASSSQCKITLKLLKNPYKTKYKHVYIDADGGFSKKFLNTVASMLRKAGWKVTVYGIGPGEHSKNYYKVRNGVYMPIYNGVCAATIKEMAASYYGGVIKSHKSVIAPSWCNELKISKMLNSTNCDLTKVKFLPRAWDDNFSPKSYKGMYYPAKFMTKNNIKYSCGQDAYAVVVQFLYGGWDAYYK